ncbi:hypothetical protein H9623_12005 [Oerskovia sp. Sa1BUA8]|uniref:Uncharacterized protein n=1 Tax=Oerskovia douganii TaxID=2762210 RepID=A0A9D5UAA2_9CELL|nr:hypothetical protein [Oerskovia douganii]MBE7701023.1 hypothetical protein [Oerskovia douganii]
MSLPDDPGLPLERPYDPSPAPEGGVDAGAQPPTDSVAPRRRVGGWGLPRLDSLVPDRLADRARAARAAVEAAHASVEAARETVRETGRRLRTPGAILGPPVPAGGVPTAPVHPVHRGAVEVAALLPRSLELPVREAVGALAPLGWTGELFLVGSEPLRVVVRRCPLARMSTGQIASGVVDTLMDVSASSDDPRTVELLDADGQVLLRSTPGARRHRGGAWTLRHVTLADGSPVAKITRATRGARVRDVVVAGPIGEVTAVTEAWDTTRRRHAGRVCRGPVELASVREHAGGRSLTISALDSDADALLVWAAVLSWWGAA